MENNILVKGKGLITKIAVSSVNGVDAFEGKRNKRVFIDVLQDEANENVVLVAYCVLDATAHFIIKTNAKSDADKYIAAVTERYAASYDGYGRSGNPLRGDYVSQKIKSENLSGAVAYVHSLAPTAPADYPYCSYGYLFEGTHGGTAVIIAENGGEMTEQEFSKWLSAGSGKGFKSVNSGKESFSSVLKECREKYLVGNVSESTIVYVLADLCQRSGAKYKKAARALGVSYKERRDLMIGVLIELMQNRGYNFSDAIALMQIYTEDRHALLLDCIVEQNRQNAYSYDHIINSFGVDDFYYDILAEIMRGLHRKYAFGFEELCVKFHVQNDILSIRARCGF